MDNFEGIPDSDRDVEQAKNRLRHYANLSPDPNNYQQLSDRQRKDFARGSKDEREQLRLYEKQNPYRINSISGALGIAEVLLSDKYGDQETLLEIQELMKELKSSGVNEGESVTKEQVVKVQKLLRQALEII